MKFSVWLTLSFENSRYHDLLQDLGYDVISAPLLNVENSADDTLRSDHQDDIDKASGFCLTSRHAVLALAAWVETHDNRPVFCVGDQTADEVRKHGYQNVISASGTRDDLIERMNQWGQEHLHIKDRGVQDKNAPDQNEEDKSIEAKSIKDKAIENENADISLSGVKSHHSEKAALSQFVMGKETPRPSIVYLSGRDISGDIVLNDYDVRRIVVYNASPISTIPSPVRDALNDKSLRAVILFSARGSQTLSELIHTSNLSDVQLEALRNTKFLCFSSKMVESLENAGVTDVLVCENPNRDSMCALIEKKMGAVS